MGDVGDFWNDVKAARKAAGLPARRSARRPAQAPSKKDMQKFAALGFAKKSEWHWQMRLDGDVLDFWPSRRKWQWRDGVKIGNWSELFALIEAHP